MSPPRCPRLFEAEALRDGRLIGAERTNYERHVAGCPACSHEVGVLEALAEALRSSPESHAVDELHARRERTRLLSAFDRALVAPGPSRDTNRRLMWSLVAAALVAGFFMLRREGPGAAPAHTASAVVHADTAALWTEHPEGSGERIVLARGALWIHVDHSSERGQLVVTLPDGELDDIGTTFSITVQEGRTVRVAVEEGHVVLRLRGRSSVAIDPGQTWLDNPRLATADASAPLSAAREPTTALAPTARRVPAPSSSASSMPTAWGPTLDFRAAMAAMEIGDNRRAATAFASFVEKHPRDPRAEDAAYSRIIALQKCADTDAMKQAALDYLRRYAKGFRRAEVERLSR